MPAEAQLPSPVTMMSKHCMSASSGSLLMADCGIVTGVKYAVMAAEATDDADAMAAAPMRSVRALRRMTDLPGVT